MLLSNLESVPAHTILRQIDVVYGSTVRSKHVGRDFMAGLKNIVGGELTAYTELLEESRQEAIDRMVVKAEALGADAVVGLRFSTSSIAQGASELFVYGTAVKAVRIPVSSLTQPSPNSDYSACPVEQKQDMPRSDNSEHTQTPLDKLPRFNPFGE